MLGVESHLKASGLGSGQYRWRQLVYSRTVLSEVAAKKATLYNQERCQLPLNLS